MGKQVSVIGGNQSFKEDDCPSEGARRSCELLTDASFFAREGPFPIGGPSDGTFIGAFGLALNKEVTETREAMYLGARGWRVISLPGLDQGCCAIISFLKKYGRKGALHDLEAAGAISEVWTDLDMCMAWKNCLLLPARSRFLVPHYGCVGHTTASYQQWWDSTNSNYWHAAHSWQVTDGSRREGRAGRCLVPPDWRKLNKPCLLDR
ncbi:hypothetical protein AMTR_s00151p00045250 [Amborella trichopoda]|uniref:Uncharacterized protein n=1 Tax=Amborella trichopoda TaxID=13333 RepID=W1NIZ7_AMBTC|nr:hypothetical protein AMTR_s00151p00045250 [Amborella trichopoda]